VRKPFYNRLPDWRVLLFVASCIAWAVYCFGCSHRKTPENKPVSPDETAQQQLKKDFVVVEIHYPNGMVVSKPTRVDSGFVVPRADSILRAWDAYENRR